MSSINNLDKLAVVIIESLYQGDEARLEKVSSELTAVEQDILKNLVDCWRSDVSQNNEKLNNLIALCDKKETIFGNLVIAEKSLELITSNTHKDYILKTFLAIEKAQHKLEKRLIEFLLSSKLKVLSMETTLIKRFLRLRH